ncbi:Hsp70-Hsp90 organizing protein [Porphyridium purpureum]|uniref:Hsp70-Hsp90 organizing protein n=1 Tax=Porphyridium purpureum TaxID=35688 RepID=A0A5J4YT06_PORPP|nr:Hsp70-Hsp90 organizing protein [Porphyridium purpureum]|eukprot:POR0443..scf227_4
MGKKKTRKSRSQSEQEPQPSQSPSGAGKEGSSLPSGSHEQPDVAATRLSPAPLVGTVSAAAARVTEAQAETPVKQPLKPVFDAGVTDSPGYSDLEFAALRQSSLMQPDDGDEGSITAEDEDAAEPQDVLRLEPSGETTKILQIPMLSDRKSERASANSPATGSDLLAGREAHRAASQDSGGSDGSVTEPRNAERFKELGNGSFGRQDYESAIEYYTQAIRIDPQYAILYSNRSAAYMKMGRLSEARQDAACTIELRPTWSRGYWRRASVELSAGEFQAALETLDAGLLYNPQASELLESRKVALDGIRAQAVESASSLSKPSSQVQAGDAAIPMEEERGAETARGDEVDPTSTRIREILYAKTYYKVLGVRRDAPIATIKRQYYKLAKELHPDKCPEDNAEAAMQTVTMAYGALINPVKRGLYDRYLQETSSSGADNDPDVSFAEWEARQGFTMLPPLLTMLLRIPVIGWAIALTLFLLMLPVLILLFVVYIVTYLLCLPYRLIMMCCCPEAFAAMRAREREEEEMYENEARWERYNASRDSVGNPQIKGSHTRGRWSQYLERSTAGRDTPALPLEYPARRGRLRMPEGRSHRSSEKNQRPPCEVQSEAAKKLTVLTTNHLIYCGAAAGVIVVYCLAGA